jgi:hypothetical protein
VKYRLGGCRLEELIAGLLHPSTTAENALTYPTTPATGQGVAVEIPDVLDLPLVRLVGDPQVQLAEVRRPTPTVPGYHHAGAAHLVHPLDVVHPDHPLLHRDHDNAWTKE